MNWFNNFTKLQKVILILIAGVVAATGLSNLSNTYQDYYVANAVTTAFFQAILLLVLSSPFLYLIRKKEKKLDSEKLVESPKRPPLINWRRVVITVVVVVALGILVGLITFITLLA